MRCGHVFAAMALKKRPALALAPHCAPRKRRRESPDDKCFVCNGGSTMDHLLEFACMTCDARVHAKCLGQILLYQHLRGTCSLCGSMLTREALAAALRMAFSKSEVICGPRHGGTASLGVRLAEVLATMHKYDEATNVLQDLLGRRLVPDAELLCRVEAAAVALSAGDARGAAAAAELLPLFAKTRGRMPKRAIEAALVASGGFRIQQQYDRAWFHVGVAARLTIETRDSIMPVLAETARIQHDEGQREDAVRTRLLILEEARLKDGDGSREFASAFSELAHAKVHAGHADAPNAVRDAISGLAGVPPRDWLLQAHLRRLRECLALTAAPARRIRAKSRQASVEYRAKTTRSFRHCSVAALRSSSELAAAYARTR